jgi:hypothetical protein
LINPDLFRRATDYVDKILRGTKTGAIPAEQPTKFDLVVNLTTARALVLKIPESFLLRATQLLQGDRADIHEMMSHSALRLRKPKRMGLRFEGAPAARAARANERTIKGGRQCRRDGR